mgnify:CR=1 FL=1
MLNNKTIYTKTFSEIKGIQQYCKISYNLFEYSEPNGKIFGIEIGYSDNFETKNTLIKNISYSKNLVLDIITYLYENSIKDESAEYIIKDIMSQHESVLSTKRAM